MFSKDKYPNYYNPTISSSAKKCEKKQMDNGTVKKICWNYSTKVDQNAGISQLPGFKKQFPNVKSRISTAPTVAKVSDPVVDQENRDNNQISCSGQCLLEVTNLPVFQGQKPTQGEIELSTLFKEYGAYSSLDAFNTKKTKSGKMEGIAYVVYKKQQLDGRLCCEAAREAIEKLNRTEFQEKMLYIRSVTRDEMDQRRQEEAYEIQAAEDEAYRRQIRNEEREANRLAAENTRLKALEDKNRLKSAVVEAVSETLGPRLEALEARLQENQSRVEEETARLRELQENNNVKTAVSETLAEIILPRLEAVEAGLNAQTIIAPDLYSEGKESTGGIWVEPLDEELIARPSPSIGRNRPTVGLVRNLRKPWLQNKNNSTSTVQPRPQSANSNYGLKTNIGKPKSINNNTNKGTAIGKPKPKNKPIPINSKGPKTGKRFMPWK